MAFMDKMKSWIGIEADEDDYLDDVDYMDDPEDYDYQEEPQQQQEQETYEPRERKRSSNVVSMGTVSSGKMKISIQAPITYDDGPAILDDIMHAKVVVLNLEMLELDKKRQIFDFVSGGVYSLGGGITKVTKDIFVIAPRGVEVDGKSDDASGTPNFTL